VLDKNSWPRGPWLTELREAIRNKLPENTCFKVAGKAYSIQELTQLLTIITPGQKIGYVTDINASRKNFELVKKLIRGSDILFCEAAFLDDDQQKADQTYHLTTSQAGRLAHQSQVKKLVIFQFSPKNHGCEQLYYQEAAGTFSGQIA